MNMNDKHSYSLLMRPADFSAEKFFSRIFSGKNFSKFFFQNFQRKKFFKILFQKFFSRIFSGKNFSKFFSKFFFSRIFSGKIFQNFFQNYFFPEFSAEKIFQNFFQKFFFQNFQRNIFSTSLSGTQELNLSGYPFHLTKAFFFFWSRRITFSIRKIF